MTTSIDTKYSDRVHNVEIKLQLSDSGLRELFNALGKTCDPAFSEPYRSLQEVVVKYEL